MDNCSKLLLELGFKCTQLGYKYLVNIINMGISGKQILPLKCCGYTYVAEKYSKSIDSVIKAIENSISYVFTFGNLSLLYDIFGYTIDARVGKPTNKQFIVTIITKILFNST